MRFSGHTPLTRMPEEKVSIQQKTLLENMWVESVEEFTAMMAAMESAESEANPTIINPLRQCESRLLEGVPQEAVTPWRQASPGGALGCQLNPDVIVMFQAHGRLSTPGSTLQQLSEVSLPPSVRLMDSTFPIRDQGGRGTCVAFATVALREYLIGCAASLSEQFLYWACKQLDGFPEEAGTFIGTAMCALSTQGVCEQNTWPYNPEHDPTNESQDPPPDGAKTQALSFIMPNTRTVAQHCVNLYKQILSGTDGNGSMPVVIATLVFNSWFRSAATHQTGKITMPLPGEMPLPGGHAMLIVGYQDDPSVPGGGYFIVRNSWSDAWAAQSPEAPGHALMPYAYIERYIVEAFTGQTLSLSTEKETTGSVAQTQPNPVTSGSSFEGKYVYTLRRDHRDMEGKLLRAGTRVIYNPQAPDEVMESTDAHRRRFVENGYGWSDRIRQVSWFRAPETWEIDLTTGLAQARARCQQFTGAIDENLMAGVGRAIPDINLSPLLYALAWMPKVRRIECIANLTESLVAALCRLGQVPEGITPTRQWQDALNHCNQLKVYQVQSKVGQFHVVCGFITPLSFSAGQAAAITPAGAEWIDLIQSIYKDWQSSSQKVKYTFYSLGSASTWTNETESHSTSDSLVLLSEVKEVDQWQTQSPPHFAASAYLRNFIERLHPETQQQKISRIKSAVDEYVSENYEGNILLEKIATNTGFRRSMIQEAFKAMQRSGHYECYRVNNDLAIRFIKGRKPKSIRIDTESCFLKYHGGILIGAFLSVVFWRLGDTFGPETLGLLSILVAVIFVYIGKCLEILIQRKSIN